MRDAAIIGGFWFVVISKGVELGKGIGKEGRNGAAPLSLEQKGINLSCQELQGEEI
jgi:hypothetical protein